MRTYKLREEEVVLYKGKAYRNTNGRKMVEVLFTNLFFVVEAENNALTGKSCSEIFTYPIEEIKVYKGKLQIIRKDAQVEVYAKGGEEYLEFLSKAEAKKFVDKAWEEITNKTKTQRAIDKVKETVDYVDETFEIDTIQITKDAITKKKQIVIKEEKSTEDHTDESLNDDSKQNIKESVGKKIFGGIKKLIPGKKETKK